jgi:hypothetical protein
MSSIYVKWATVGIVAVAVTLLAAFVASKNVNSVPFTLGVAGVAVVLLSALDQFLLSHSGAPAFLRWFGMGLLRGGVAGLASWLGMMLFVRLFVEVGDKFPLFVVFFLPFAAILGAVGGGLASGVSYRLRSRRT